MFYPRTSSLSWEWTSCLRRTSSRSPGPGRSRGSSPNPSRSKHYNKTPYYIKPQNVFYFKMKRVCYCAIYFRQLTGFRLNYLSVLFLIFDIILISFCLPRWQRCSPTTPGSWCPLNRPSPASRRSWKASTTTCPRWPSTWSETSRRSSPRPRGSRPRLHKHSTMQTIN